MKLPKNPAPNPKSTKQLATPATNKSVLNTKYNRNEIFLFSCSLITDSFANDEIYTGNNGNIHGEKKESIPAKNTVLIYKDSVFTIITTFFI